MLKYLLYATYSLLLLTAGYKPVAAQKKAGKHGITVMTYNIHHANPPSRDKDHIDLDTIAATIRAAKADLVAIQELDSAVARSGNTFQLKLLAEKLNMYYYFAKAIPYQGGSYGVGILSRYPIRDTQTIQLPKITGFTGEDRVLAVAKVTLAKNKEIYFGCTHLDVNKEENRILQTKAIAEFASKLSVPFIMGGDLNSTNEKTAIQQLYTVLQDASSKQEPTIPVLKPVRRIDYILYTRNAFKVTKEDVLTSRSYESDHLPFVAHIAW